MKRIVVIDGECNGALCRALTGQEVLFLNFSGEHWREYQPGGEGVTHATVCCAILAEEAPGYGITELSVMDGDGKLSPELLRLALMWCAEEGVEGISMSIGTQRWFEMRCFLPALEILGKKGVKMVAAAANDGRLSYPSAFPEVCGVRYCAGLSGIRRRAGAWDGVEAEVGFPYPAVLARLQEEYGFPRFLANSMAAPWLLGRWVSRGTLWEAEAGAVCHGEEAGVGAVCHGEEAGAGAVQGEIPVLGLPGGRWASGGDGWVEALLEEFRHQRYTAILLGEGWPMDPKAGWFGWAEEEGESLLPAYMERIEADIFLLATEPGSRLLRFADCSLEPGAAKEVRQAVQWTEKMFSG